MRWTIERGQAENDPVTLERSRDHLRLFVDETGHPDDDLVEIYIKAAVAWAEGFTRRDIAQREVILTTDNLQEYYSLPVSPVRELTSAEYLDDQGDWQPLSNESDIASDPPHIQLSEFPEDWKGGRNSVRFTVDAGYEDVPGDMLAGLLLLVGHWYENRESVVIGSIAQNIPLTSETILYPFRALDFER